MVNSELVCFVCLALENENLAERKGREHSQNVRNKDGRRIRHKSVKINPRQKINQCGETTGEEEQDKLPVNKFRLKMTIGHEINAQISSAIRMLSLIERSSG